ncbi:hypothetical protein RND71_022432 [Anisodus tanguticus]|uniref:Uncharacterized protein n=1 Tax=Anisodus tanguticus TaxID=243964 RepID=A0AAE1RTP4_9SOLA|nr:hypothetical protein RND71_022432 [Anisodus tanguticus]
MSDKFEVKYVASLPQQRPESINMMAKLEQQQMPTSSGGVFRHNIDRRVAVGVSTAKAGATPETSKNHLQRHRSGHESRKIDLNQK